MIAAALAAIALVSPSENRWQAAIAIAERRFPNTVCEPVIYKHGRTSSAFLATFSPSDCRITVSSRARLPFSSLCSLLMHERGHAAGYKHSSNPRSIMHSPIYIVPRACRGDWRKKGL